LSAANTNSTAANEARAAYHRSKTSGSTMSEASQISITELLDDDLNIKNDSLCEHTGEIISSQNNPTERGSQQQDPSPRRSSASSMYPSFATNNLLLGEAPTIEGWLWKLGKPGAFGASTYRKRYAILRGIQLFYYREKPSDANGAPQRAPTGVLRCRAVRPLDPPDTTNQIRFCFIIDVVGGRALSCFVESDQDRQRWLTALSDVIEARQRDLHPSSPRDSGTTPSSPAPFASLASFVWSSSSS